MLIDEELTYEIRGAAMEVHRELGPGLLESVYERCLCHELKLRNIAFQSQLTLPLRYKGDVLESGLRIDVLVAERVVLELKSVDKLLPVHDAQILTYLKLAKKRLGLLINFNVPLIKDGIRRFVV